MNSPLRRTKKLKRLKRRRRRPSRKKPLLGKFACPLPGDGVGGPAAVNECRLWEQGRLESGSPRLLPCVSLGFLFLAVFVEPIFFFHLVRDLTLKPLGFLFRHLFTVLQISSRGQRLDQVWADLFFWKNTFESFSGVDLRATLGQTPTCHMWRYDILLAISRGSQYSLDRATAVVFLGPNEFAQFRWLGYPHNWKNTRRLF